MMKSMRAVQARLDKQEEAIEMLLNHVTKQDQRIQELTTKNNEFQARSMRKNIVIAGIKEAPNDNCLELATDFFTTQLGIAKSIPLKVAHRIGMGSNRPMVVKLRDFDDKSLIFQHTQKLKGSSYFVSEQLPEEMSEVKRQQLRIKGQNKQLPPTEQLAISIKREKIYINNKQLRPPIEVPTALSWLNKSQEEQRSIKQIAIKKGPTDTTTSSTFISYSAEVNTIDEVQKAYYKVFTMEPRATHIVCAYMLPGLNFAKHQAGLDDREFGASRQILRKMQEGHLFNRAVFVARYYGGVHLGADRFRIYKDLALSALDKLPHPRMQRLDIGQLLGAPPTQTGATPFTFQAPLQVPTRFRPLPVPDPIDIQQRLQNIADTPRSTESLKEWSECSQEEDSGDDLVTDNAVPINIAA